MLFFACLFVMVGSVDACGILDGAGTWVAGVWRANPAWGAITVAWGAAVLTCVLNAGPTTALLIPLLFAGLGPIASHEPIWWALSLGVCAGSSGTLTGATAGPVTASMLEKRGLQLTFQGYARTGVPMMLIFLLISSCYLALVITEPVAG